MVQNWLPTLRSYAKNDDESEFAVAVFSGFYADVRRLHSLQMLAAKIPGRMRFGAASARSEIGAGVRARPPLASVEARYLRLAAIPASVNTYREGSLAKPFGPYLPAIPVGDVGTEDDGGTVRRFVHLGSPLWT